jgi:deoxycytidylate deaminase
LYLKNRTEKMTMYITNRPCLTCLTKIVQIGIKKIIYDEEYPYDEKIYKGFERVIEIKKMK